MNNNPLTLHHLRVLLHHHLTLHLLTTWQHHHLCKVFKIFVLFNKNFENSSTCFFFTHNSPTNRDNYTESKFWTGSDKNDLYPLSSRNRYESRVWSDDDDSRCLSSVLHFHVSISNFFKNWKTHGKI